MGPIFVGSVIPSFKKTLKFSLVKNVSNFAYPFGKLYQNDTPQLQSYLNYLPKEIEMIHRLFLVIAMYFQASSPAVQ